MSKIPSTLLAHSKFSVKVSTMHPAHRMPKKNLQENIWIWGLLVDPILTAWHSLTPLLHHPTRFSKSSCLNYS